MSHITVNCKKASNARLDMRWLSSALMHAENIDDVNQQTILVGNQSTSVTDMFSISGDFPAKSATLENSHSKLDYVGLGLTAEYSIQVQGDCGHFAGANLSGGNLVIDGNTLDFVGAAMKTGLIEVHGNVRDYAGGAHTGDKRGMAGGTILIHGNAGDFLGDLMRRGMIMVTGDIGNYCANRMIAGTITNLGSIGSHIGQGMRRGTILIPSKPQDGLPGFRDCGRHSLGYLTLLVKELRERKSDFQSLHPMRRRVQKYVGDTSTSGQGELLIWIG